MRAIESSEEGLWGRVLLGVLAIGLVGLGLFAALAMGADEDAGPNDVLYGLGMVGFGVLGLIGAAIGRAMSRWVLALFGVLFLAQASQIVLDLRAYRSAPDRVILVLVAGLVLIGVSVVTVAVAQMVLHRNRLQTRN